MASWLEGLPDLVLLNVFKRLDLTDLINISSLSDRLNDVLSESSIVRRASFEKQFSIGDKACCSYIRQHASRIEELNLNHCYWLTARSITSAVAQCTKLRSLSVLECRLKPTTLAGLLQNTQHLTSLAFSVQSFNDLKRDVFTKAKDALRNLRRIYLYYSSRELSSMLYLGEHTTLLDYCDNLEHIYIGSAGMAIPELYRPLVSNPEKFLQLKSMCITCNIHAGAQMLYYGTLSQFPNERIHFNTILMPNVNFKEFMRKPDFRACLENLKELKHLDLYGSKVEFQNEFITRLESARGLEFLNIGASLITSQQLQSIANSCAALTALNLTNCSTVLQASTEGLEAVFRCCPGLRHLNLGDTHHHVHVSARANQTALHTCPSHFIKGLESVCLATCMLATPGGERRKRGGGAGAGEGCSPPPFKRRCLTGGGDALDDAVPSTSWHHSNQPDDDSFLGRLVAGNPGLTEVEIVATELSSIIHQNRYIKPRTHRAFDPCVEAVQVNDQHLEPLSRLTQLRRLTLMGLPGVTSGTCLLSIASRCSQLESLTLGFLGHAALNSGYFYEALTHLSALRDLRLEQTSLALRRELFSALSCCSRLQRLCVIAKHSDGVCSTHLTGMVDKLRELVCLQVFVSVGSYTTWRQLTTALKNKYIKSRPAFVVCVFPLFHKSLPQVVTSLHAGHFQELTRFESRVATFPRELGTRP